MARAPKSLPVQTPAPVVVQPKVRRTALFMGMLSFFLCAALGAAGYFYWQYQKVRPGVAEAKEIKSLTATIGAMLLLPEDEEPTLATVTDREKLADQPFFQKAENGDKVLIYSASGRAILYRPSAKKIVDVTTVNIQTPPAATETPIPVETPTVPTPPPISAVPAAATPTLPALTRIALYNGSTVVGITNRIEAQLNQVLNTVAVVSKTNAAKNDYTGTLVVDLTGSNTSVAQSVAQTLGGSIGSLPTGETAPTGADLLVIIGNTP